MVKKVFQHKSKNCGGESKKRPKNRRLYQILEKEHKNNTKITRVSPPLPEASSRPNQPAKGQETSGGFPDWHRPQHKVRSMAVSFVPNLTVCQLLLQIITTKGLLICYPPHSCTFSIAITKYLFVFCSVSARLPVGQAL